MSTPRRRIDAWTAALFATALALPVATAAWSDDPGASVRPEGRVPAPWPTLPGDIQGWTSAARRFESAFGDRLGLREELLRARGALLLLGLGVAPTPKLVPGAGGRLLLDDNGLLAHLRGALPLDVAALRGWRRALESRARFVAAHGGRLVLAIAPENASVYPDAAPSAWRSVGPSPTDQFVAELGTRGPCTLVDLRVPLRAARALDRPDDPACYPYGTHWTPRGAFAAVRAIAAALARELPRYPALLDAALDDVRYVPAAGVGDSWAGRLHLEGLLVNRDWTLVDPGQRWQAVHEPRFERDELVTVRGEVELPTAIVVHDSFGSIPRSVLPRAFSRATFLWQQDFPVERIERERPDVVLLLYAERFLLRPPWPILGGELDRDLVAEIAASHGVLARYDPADLARGCDARGPLELRADSAGIHLRETAPGGLLLLPAIPAAPEVALVLQMEVDVEVDTKLGVLFATRDEPEYSRGRALRAPVAAGRSVVTVEVLEPDRAGRLALRMEAMGTPWTLRSMVARGIRR